MDIESDEFDFVILGTGLTECILSGILSSEGKKVLHLDSNTYYGSESSSLNLDQLLVKTNKVLKNNLGKNKDYNIDLIPKFLMGDEELINVLAKTGVTKYLEFKEIKGSFLCKNINDKKIYKVPANTKEALKSDLIGFFEKRRVSHFFEFIKNFDKEPGKFTSESLTIDVFRYFNLEKISQDFIGYANCLFLDDSFKNKTIKETIKAINLYANSLFKFNGFSPYIYPSYGLGELPQAFARLSAVYGGTYMLNADINDIFYENNKITGVKINNSIIKTKCVITDPSYVLDKVINIGHIMTVICILNHPISGAENLDSLQIIIPADVLNRKNNVYISVLSENNLVCPKGYYIATISSLMETDHSNELDQVLGLFDPVCEYFVIKRNIYEANKEKSINGLCISKSYDATTNFQSVMSDVKRCYKIITENELEIK